MTSHAENPSEGIVSTNGEVVAVPAGGVRKRPKPGERRVQILQTLAAMLEQPGAERITTAALAAKLDVSEAALYRHFASKAQMFEGLIEFIEQSVFTLANQINERETAGRPHSIARRSSRVPPPCSTISAPASAMACTACSKLSGREACPAVSSSCATECSGRWPAAWTILSAQGCSTAASGVSHASNSS